MLPEPLTVTLQVIDALEQVGARYVIGGSLASTIHGVVRTTLDTDIIADLHLQQVQRFADLLVGVFYFDIDAIRHAIRQRSSFNLIHLAICSRLTSLLQGTCLLTSSSWIGVSCGSQTPIRAARSTWRPRKIHLGQVGVVPSG